jgi:hypothetical protein
VNTEVVWPVREQLLGTAINLRLLKETARDEHEHSRSEADEKHGPPREIRRQQRETHGKRQCRKRPAQSPACLHRTECLAAMPSADRLAHQYGTCGPFPTESESHHCARCKELVEVLCESRDEGKNRVPGDGNL